MWAAGVPKTKISFLTPSSPKGGIYAVEDIFPVDDFVAKVIGLISECSVENRLLSIDTDSRELGYRLTPTLPLPHVRGLVKLSLDRLLLAPGGLLPMAAGCSGLKELFLGSAAIELPDNYLSHKQDLWAEILDAFTENCGALVHADLGDLRYYEGGDGDLSWALDWACNPDDELPQRAMSRDHRVPYDMLFSLEPKDFIALRRLLSTVLEKKEHNKLWCWR